MSVGKSSVNFDEFLSQEDSAHVPALRPGKTWTLTSGDNEQANGPALLSATWPPGEEPAFVENVWSRHGPGDAHHKCHYPITSGSKKPPTAAWDLLIDPEPTVLPKMGHGRSKGGGAMDWKKQTLKVQNDSKTKMYWLS